MKRYLIIAIFAALAASVFGGAAFAEDGAPEFFVNITHMTRGVLTDDGKGDPASAVFRFVYPYINNFGKREDIADSTKLGTVTFDLAEPARAIFEGHVAGKWEEIKEEWAKGKKTLSAWYRLDQGSNTYAFIGHTDGPAYSAPYIYSENALAGAEFEVDMTETGSGRLTGRFPRHIPTAEQKKNYPVPYLELITDATGENCIGLRWKFVDNADDKRTPLVKTDNDKNNISVNVLWIRAATATGGTAYDSAIAPSFIGTEVGKPLEGVWMFKTPVAAKSIDRCRIQFNREFRDGFYNAWEYHWEWRRKSNTDVTPITPSTEKVNAARTAAANDLKGLKAPADIVGSDASYITTNEAVWYDFDGTVKANTSAVVALSQDVAKAGDAVVFAASGDMALPISEKSITGTDLPKVETVQDVLDRYHVWKTFDDGTRADLLALYGVDLFVISTTGVKLNATIVVIDNDVDGITDERVKKFGKYGVMLSDADPNNKFLYVWDGRMNGVVNDPISLEAGSKESKGSSGSCATGAGAMIAVLALAAIRRRG